MRIFPHKIRYSDNAANWLGALMNIASARDVSGFVSETL
jgi:hypothetical protein